MKILAIRGCNLASLEGDFEIDFTSEPLKSAGIFAITGQTGAGKSTILDALCLALFDNAPRLNKAESINISDIEDKTITQKDSRNILRRGTSEGYAEVDFIALNGDKYRSRWMVRRARGKADGALQATTMRLENLSTGKEEQGTKSNLLNRIVELIGLTFDQFTRAVLLAQGDFANFLKAKSNEKAELLEKLTGTEIYSKISEKIYHKTQEAKNALDLLQQRIKDIKLLSEEDLSLFEKERQTIGSELTPLKKDLLLIERKLSWIKQEEQLQQEIKEAKESLVSIQQKIEEATPRYEYMDKLDASSEIRDSYIELNNKKGFVKKASLDLSQREQELKSITSEYQKILPELNSAKDSLEKTNKEHETLKPEIDKAKELDLNLKNQQQKLSDLQKEIETFQTQEKRINENIDLIVKQEEQNAKNQKELDDWFIQNEVYRTIVPKIELIVNLINNTSTINKNKETTLKSLDSSQSLLRTYIKQFEQQEQEFEKLNSLLPTEVINLRNKLQDGEPCAVCGSIHHPFKDDIEQNKHIKEEELEASKTKLQDTINQTKLSIEQAKKSITEFETYIQSFDGQLKNNINSLAEHLEVLPDWKSKLESDTLVKELTDIATKWNKDKETLDNSTNQIKNLKIRQEAEEKAKATLLDSLKEKQEQYTQQEALLVNNRQERLQLLGGKSVNELELFYAQEKNKFSKEYDELRAKKDSLEMREASLEGNITQLKKDIDTNNEDVDRFSIQVQNWINDSKHKISIEMLNELVAKPREWIVQEKQYLTDLKSNELVIKTKLEERQNRLIKHQKSEDKPLELETKDILATTLIIKQEEIESKTKRINEVDVALLAHKNGKEQIKSFEKDLTEKRELYENWAKLNELLGSANGNKFKTIAQGYTLDILLSYANKHLEELSKRYKLEKISDSLALQVIDNDMLGEVRSVHSLSGGESFLISLALALGLSSLSSDRMLIESLFIDEGFGALDIDTLSIAMDALDNLQTQGRKIGVISHVEEMKERIMTQIQVTKSANGRSFVKTIG